MRARIDYAPYAAFVAALGAMLLSSTFVYVWVPLPAWVPGRNALACTYGALLLLSALGLAWRKTLVPSSAVVALLFLGWLVLVQVPRVVAAPSHEGLWAGAGQIATAVAGGWILFATSAAPTEGPGRWLRGPHAVRIARVLFALALPLFGLHHFVDLAGAGEAVPAWLPFHVAWAWVTGAAHVAAGVAILVGIAAPLAATLEAIMIGAFVLLVHVPGVIEAPKDYSQWTMLVVAAVIGGAAWIVARSYAALR